VGQLEHDLGAVPQDGVELHEPVQSVLQEVQPLIGQTWPGGWDKHLSIMPSVKPL